MSNRWRPFKLRFSAILLPTFWTNRIPRNIYVSLPKRAETRKCFSIDFHYSLSSNSVSHNSSRPLFSIQNCSLGLNSSIENKEIPPYAASMCSFRVHNISTPTPQKLTNGIFLKSTCVSVWAITVKLIHWTNLIIFWILQGIILSQINISYFHFIHYCPITR